MWQKAYFLVALVFFLVMNVLLWRSQYGHKDIALPIPVETVTRRVFSATDDSNLDILHHGTKVGYCRWSPQTISRIPVATGPSGMVPEGMVGGITGYSISFDGTVMIEDIDRIRFNFSMELGTNYVWRSIRARLAFPDYRLEASSDADERTVHVTLSQGDRTQHNVFSFDDLGNPQTLMRRLGGGFLAPALGLAGLESLDPPAAGLSLGLDWEAHTDRHRLGDTTFPVYRLHTRLLDAYHFRALILPSGELLRVELPDELVLVNETLTGM